LCRSFSRIELEDLKIFRSLIYAESIVAKGHPRANFWEVSAEMEIKLGLRNGRTLALRQKGQPEPPACGKPFLLFADRMQNALRSLKERRERREATVQ
jgi:hypothetical protein